MDKSNKRLVELAGQDAQAFAAELEGLNNKALYRLTTDLEEQKLFAAAELAYRRILERDPEHSSARGALGHLLYYLQRDSERAEVFLADATERFPDDALLQWQRGVNLAWQPRSYDEALPFLQRAAKLDQSPENRAAVGWCLLAAGNLEEGVLLSKQVLSSRKAGKDVLLECQFQLYLLGPVEEREQRLRAVAKLMKAGARCQDWDFGALVGRALAAGHPGGSQLHRLADVIDGTSEPDGLDGWAAWQAAREPMPPPPLPAPPAPTAAVSAFIEEVSRELARLSEFDSDRELFGADEHDYALKPVLSEAEVGAFEERWGVRLPEDYRRFLLELGNGGAGPHYGLFPLGMTDSDDNDDLESYDERNFDLCAPFPHSEAWNDEELLEEDEAAYNDAHGTGTGSVPISPVGSGVRDWLIVSGPESGNVWRDRSPDQRGVEPVAVAGRARATFAEWYLDWLRISIEETGEE